MIGEATLVRTNSISDPYPTAMISEPGKIEWKDRAFNVRGEGGKEVQENLVMLHGYEAGLGFFYKNFVRQVSSWKLPLLSASFYINSVLTLLSMHTCGKDTL